MAEQRSVDRSVISKQISRLEEELNVRLLNRTNLFVISDCGWQ
ncbi:LysR family transcriptional regulator [Vibrio lentus]|nr:LysR family transcriptional regulator [Vibrio lentus]